MLIFRSEFHCACIERLRAFVCWLAVYQGTSGNVCFTVRTDEGVPVPDREVISMLGWSKPE